MNFTTVANFSKSSSEAPKEANPISWEKSAKPGNESKKDKLIYNQSQEKKQKANKLSSAKMGICPNSSWMQSLYII